MDNSLHRNNICEQSMAENGVSNSHKTVYLVIQSRCAFLWERKKKRERERESKTRRNAVLLVVVNRTFEKIASKKSYIEQRDKQ